MSESQTDTQTNEQQDTAAADAAAQESQTALGGEGAVDQNKGQETALGSGDQEAGGDTSEGGESEEISTGAPESYAEFTVPEGFELAPEYQTVINETFKELGLTQEGAQKLIDSHVKGLQAAQAAAGGQHKDTVSQWLDESKADKEIGGAKWDTTLNYAKQALEKFGTPELNQALRDFGIGNHVEFIRVFSKIGQLMAEDSPSGGEGAHSKPEDRATRMYGESGGLKAS